MITAIYGGSFNPPHKGHQSVVRLLNETVRPDRILIIPAFMAPLKTLADNSPTPAERMELCHLAFDHIPGTEVSDIEITRAGTSYTIDTLETLAKLYPDDSFLLTVGTDQLLAFRNWRRFKDILAMAELAVFSRRKGDGEALRRAAEELTASYGARIRLIGNEPVVISSDEIRRAIRGQIPRTIAGRYLDPAIRDYVWRNGFYRDDER